MNQIKFFLTCKKNIFIKPQTKHQKLNKKKTEELTNFLLFTKHDLLNLNPCDKLK